MLDFIKNSETNYEVRFKNKHLGFLIMNIDGDFLFWVNEDLKGGWNWYVLKEKSKKIKEINQKYETNI